MQGKVIATDLDGTLFYPKKKIRMVTKQTKSFMTKFIADGGKWVLVSSRGNSFLDKVKEKIGLPLDMIGSNGAYVTSGGKQIQDITFSPEEVKILIKDLYNRVHSPLIMLNAKGMPTIFLKYGSRPIPKFLYFTYELTQGVYREPWIRDDETFYTQIEKRNAQRMMVWVSWSKRRTRRLRSILQVAYPNFNFVDCQQFIEITPRACSKASALSFYLDYNRIKEDNLIVVGDSGNDVPMFTRFYENSYCMEHSKSSVKKKAKHIIKQVSDLEGLLYPSADSQPKQKGDKNESN